MIWVSNKNGDNIFPVYNIIIDESWEDEREQGIGDYVLLLWPENDRVPLIAHHGTEPEVRAVLRRFQEWMKSGAVGYFEFETKVFTRSR